MGLTVDEVSSPPVEIWPDNQVSVNTFIALSTQWIVTDNGASGLNYQAIEPVLRLTNTNKKLWSDIFSDLRIMESAALQEMRKK
jgi:hypothetical protein